MRCLVHALILAIPIIATTVGATVKAIAQDRPADSVQMTVWAADGKQAFFLIGDQAYYFNNDSDRLCYTFRIVGNWHPEGPGLWRSEDGKGFAGVAVVSMQQLQNDAASLGLLKQYDGPDLINMSTSWRSPRSGSSIITTNGAQPERSPARHTRAAPTDSKARPASMTTDPPFDLQYGSRLSRHVHIVGSFNANGRPA